MALRPCKECNAEISTDAKTCPHCGKQQRAGLLGGCLMVVLIIFILGTLSAIVSAIRSTSSNSSSVNPMIAQNHKDLALANVKLDYKWNKDDMNIMTANFTVKNDSDYGVKDIEIKCDHFAKSGTNIDSNTRTIYDVVEAHSTKRFRDFNMGFIHSQVQTSSCAIHDLALAP